MYARYRTGRAWNTVSNYKHCFPMPFQAKGEQNKATGQASRQSCEVGITSPFGWMGDAARASCKPTATGRGHSDTPPLSLCTPWLPLKRARRAHSTLPPPVLGKKAALHEGSWKFPEWLEALVPCLLSEAGHSEKGVGSRLSSQHWGNGGRR